MKSYKAGVGGGKKNLLNLRVKKQVQNKHPPELTTVRFSGFPLYDMKLIISSSLDFVQAHCKKVTTCWILNPHFILYHSLHHFLLAC